MNIAFSRGTKLLKKPTRDEAAEKCPDARRVAPIRDWDCVREAALCNVLRLRLVVFSIRFISYFARLALSLTRKSGGGSEIKSESFWAFSLYFARLALSLTRKSGGGSEIKSESFWAFSLYFARLALSLTRKSGGGSEIKAKVFCTFALYFARLALTLANKRTGGATIDVVTPLKCCLNC